MTPFLAGNLCCLVVFGGVIALAAIASRLPDRCRDEQCVLCFRARLRGDR